MRKQIMITVTLIYFEAGGIRKYIKATSARAADDKRLPVYTDDIDQAHYYSNEEHAQETISKIHNVWGRVFKTITLEMPEEKVKQRKYAATMDAREDAIN